MNTIFTVIDATKTVLLTVLIEIVESVAEQEKTGTKKEIFRTLGRQNQNARQQTIYRYRFRRGEEFFYEGNPPTKNLFGDDIS